MSDLARTDVSARVRDFYEHMPFNYYSTTEDAAQRVRQNPIRTYSDLDALLRDDSVQTVLELGCGAGWATNSIALHYGKQVTAVDMTEKALVRAADVSRLVGTEARTTFVRSDLFDFRTSERFDLVLSIGVLHHTHDCRRAFEHLCGFVSDDGFAFVGLYHQYGRKVFLDMFRDILANQGEAAALRHYATLNPDIGDDTHLRSWFRDQVLHPQETQHSLAEVLDWLDQNRLDLVSTSINGYGHVDDRAALIDLEPAYEALSNTRNRLESTFFPGFFTVLAASRGQQP